MISPLSFSTRDELVRALKKCDRESWFRDRRKHRWDVEEAVRVSVGPNTFRFFRGLSSPPSVVYREWAMRAITPEFMDCLCGCDNQEAFDKLLRGMSASLRRSWFRGTGQDMQIGPAIKLPSLLLKHVCASAIVPAGRLRAATGLLHTPLDSYTLAAIRVVHSG